LDLPLQASVYDVIYNPRVSRLVRRAQAAGLPASGGLGMLLEQAALSFRIWTGVNVPRPVVGGGSGGLMSLRLLTAGESHGPALSAILDGLPAGCRWTRM
jgi:shikimate dehydrogenase